VIPPAWCSRRCGRKQVVEVFYLDTDFLFPETYKLRDVASAKYGFEPAGYMSLLTPAQQAAKHGDALWARDPDACCAIRKVEPNRRALEGKRAWISGIRRDQAKTRTDIPLVEWDDKFGLVKINALAAWTESQVWKYIADNGVPYNELHDRGYPSIGCTYCTKPVKPGETPQRPLASLTRPVGLTCPRRAGMCGGCRG
jgi:phosphoadenosine phosphosulfate reductase